MKSWIIPVLLILYTSPVLASQKATPFSSTEPVEVASRSTTDQPPKRIKRLEKAQNKLKTNIERRKKKGKTGKGIAIWALVLSILSIVVPGLFFLSMTLGIMGEGRLENGEGRGMAVAAIVISATMMVLWAALFGVAIFTF